MTKDKARKAAARREAEASGTNYTTALRSTSRDIPFAVKRALEARDKSKCRICGGLGTERMHRMRRREGGHSLSNLLLGCHTCHRRAHANPEKAYERGWHVRANGIAVPADVPMWTLGGWVKLDDEGGVEVIAPATTLDPEPPENLH